MKSNGKISFGITYPKVFHLANISQYLKKRNSLNIALEKVISEADIDGLCME